MKSTAPRPPSWTAPAGCSRPSSAAGAGAVAFEGSMVDLPVVIRAQRLLERAASWSEDK